MRVRLKGGPCHGRTYDLPKPLAAALLCTLDNGRQVATYRLDWHHRGGHDYEAVYTHERTE